MSTITLKHTFGLVEKVPLRDFHVLQILDKDGVELPEDDLAAEWNAATSYAVGDLVYRVATHRVYSCVIAGVSATEPEKDADRWHDMRPSNRMAWTDMYRYTRTRSADQLTLVLRPQQLVDTLWFDAVAGSTLTVGVTNGVGGPVVLPTAKVPMYRAGLNWQTFFLQPVFSVDSAFWGDVPVCRDPIITLTIDAPGSLAELGKVRIGRFIKLGWTEYGADFERRSYSYWKEEADGTVKMLKRPGAGNVNVKVFLDPDNPDMPSLVDSLLERYDADPTLWIGHTQDNLRPLRLDGIFSGRMSFDGYGQRILTGTIKGMV